MRKTPLKRIGKIGKVNIKANQRLKEMFMWLNHCEIQLEDCLKTWPLQFCHKHKRDWYKGDVEKLSDYNQVVIGCQPCHEKIEHNQELTEATFKRLRNE